MEVLEAFEQGDDMVVVTWGFDYEFLEFEDAILCKGGGGECRSRRAG